MSSASLNLKTSEKNVFILALSAETNENWSVKERDPAYEKLVYLGGFPSGGASFIFMYVTLEVVSLKSICIKSP